MLDKEKMEKEEKTRFLVFKESFLKEKSVEIIQLGLEQTTEREEGEELNMENENKNQEHTEKSLIEKEKVNIKDVLECSLTYHEFRANFHFMHDIFEAISF